MSRNAKLREWGFPEQIVFDSVTFRQIENVRGKTKMTNTPEYTTRTKNIDIAVWNNDGNKSATLRKSWKKKGDENWSEAKIVLFPNEIQGLIDMLVAVKDRLN